MVGRVTHCNIELFWDQDEKYSEPDSDERIKYCVQEEEGNSRRFHNVYWLVYHELCYWVILKLKVASKIGSNLASSYAQTKAAG